MGINSITNIVRNSNKLSKVYKGTINDVEKLDIFVNDMIKAGIQSKDVAYNTWFISGNKLTTDKSFKMRAGQSRMVLLPPDENIVYKIALNNAGISGNEIESNIYEKLGKPKTTLSMLKSFTK